MHVRIVFLLAAFVAADNANSPEPLTAKAVAHLDLSVAGYKELSAMARRSEMVNFTIHFIDRDHILLTYNPKKMIRRLPDCPPTHADHFIHAAGLFHIDRAYGYVRLGEKIHRFICSALVLFCVPVVLKPSADASARWKFPCRSKRLLGSSNPAASACRRLNPIRLCASKLRRLLWIVGTS